MGVMTRSVVSPVLREPPSLDEGFNGVLEVDAVLRQMTMTPMVLTIYFCPPQAWREQVRDA